MRGGYGQTSGILIGYNGGNGAARCGGGGGGAGGAGVNSLGNTPGAGANAFYSNITGTNTGYGGGGSGGILYGGVGQDSYMYGYGGQGGGGGTATNQIYAGGNGGPGVVIIKYPSYLQANIANVSGINVHSTSTVGDYNITSFTTSHAATSGASFTVKFE